MHIYIYIYIYIYAFLQCTVGTNKHLHKSSDNTKQKKKEKEFARIRTPTGQSIEQKTVRGASAATYHRNQTRKNNVFIQSMFNENKQKKN